MPMSDCISSIPRKIVHCDCDCFYASVEMRDNPALVGRPLAVGGEVGQRGVIATCNYEARAFGVHSAMPTARARQLCPQLMVVPPDIPRYREVSHAISDIFADYTHLIEPLSLDEAYLDVSGTSLFKGSATLIARDIRARVREEVGICISAGVAPNKFLAKVASDWEKPDGLFVITPDQVAEFVQTLPVNKIYGVGKITAGRLSELGVELCSDLLNFSEAKLVHHFGRFGSALYQRCRGIDNRPVVIDRVRKSVSVETTFNQDISVELQGEQAVIKLLTQLFKRLKNLKKTPVLHKYFVKLRFSDFTITTLERSELKQLILFFNEDAMSEVENFVSASLPVFRPLLMDAAARKSLDVRLIGLGVRLQSEEGTATDKVRAQQLNLLDNVEFKHL